MPKTLSGVTPVIAIMVYAIFVTPPAVARDSLLVQPQQDFLVWTSFAGTDGLTQQIPAVGARVFAEHITGLQARLNRQRQDLAELAENKELGIGDAILSVVLPGGLLYAGIRQRDCDQTKKDLAEVSALIEALSRDLLQYQYATGVVVFAQLQ